MCFDTPAEPSRLPVDDDDVRAASVNIFFLNCGVLDDDGLHKSNVFDVEYGNSCGDFFDSDDGSETCGILCELELSCNFRYLRR